MSLNEFGCEKAYIQSMTDTLQRDVLITFYCDKFFTFINLVDFYYRKINQNAALMIVLIVLFFPMCFMAIAKIAEKFLSPTMQNLSRTFKFSPALAAMTLIAFANGSPDIIACYSYAFKPNAIFLSLGTLLGGFIFSGTLVVAGVALVVGEPIKLPRNTILKELGFYGGALLTITFWGLTKEIGTNFVWTFAGLYLAYMISTGFIEKYDRQRLKLITKNLDISQTAQKAHRSPTRIMPHKMTLRKDSNTSVDLEELAAYEIRTDDKFEEDSDSDDELATTRRQKSPSLLSEFVDSDAGVYHKMVMILVALGATLTVPSPNNPLVRLNLKAIVVAFSIPFIASALELAEVNFSRVMIIGLISGILTLVLELIKFKRNLLEVFYQSLTILAAVAWIKLFSTLILDLITFIAYYISMPEIVLTVLLLALGNTVGALFNNRALAMHGEEVMGALASYSGQLFTMYIGLSWSVYSFHNTGDTEFDLFLGLRSSQDLTSDQSNNFFVSRFVVTVLGFAWLLLIFTGGYYLRSNFVLKPSMAYGLISFYAIFVVATLTLGVLRKV